MQGIGQLRTLKRQSMEETIHRVQEDVLHVYMGEGLDVGTIESSFM